MTGQEKRLRELARGIGDRLRTMLPASVGFTLFLSTYGPGGWITYLSSVQRADMFATIPDTRAMRRAIGKTVRYQLGRGPSPLRSLLARFPAPDDAIAARQMIDAAKAEAAAGLPGIANATQRAIEGAIAAGDFGLALHMLRQLAATPRPDGTFHAYLNPEAARALEIPHCETPMHRNESNIPETSRKLVLPGPAELLNIADVPGALRAHADLMEALRYQREANIVGQAIISRLEHELEQWMALARHQANLLATATPPNKTDRKGMTDRLRAQAAHTEKVLVTAGTGASGPMEANPA